MGPFEAVSIFSAFFQAMLYGFSVLMFILTMWILLGTHRRHKPNVVMVGASCALMLLCTAEMALNMARIYQGFVSVGPSLPGGPEQYFGSAFLLTFVTKSILFNAQSLILDAIVIYRAYVVWQNFYVVIFPILSWCGLLAVSIGTNVALTDRHTPTSFAGDSNPWITALFCLDLTTNVSATVLLSYKIWAVTRGTSAYRSSEGLAPVLRVAIESGAIYTITMSAGLVLFLLHTRGMFVIIDIASPIISIVMNMIVVRVGLVKERKKRCCTSTFGTRGETASPFVPVTMPMHMRPGHVRDRPESEVALHGRAGHDDMERESVMLKLMQLARLVQDDPLTPDSSTTHGGNVDEDMKSVDLTADSARDSSFQIIARRDIV